MPEVPDELARGTIFAGRYEIIEELGAGGMGRVFRAHDTKLNEEGALKLIKAEIAAERRVVERFRNEIKIARKIRHKNVCGMYDFHEEGKTLYLTMEYVRGEDLKSLIHRTKALTVGTAVSVAGQIAEGLAETHKLGIIHRDLKPGNIMIDKDGQAKIMDFGIARANTDILALYSEVALTIARDINAQLTAQDIENLSRSRKVDPEAYKLYLQIFKRIP